MISRNKLKDIRWIDLFSPSKDEIRTVTRECDVHPLLADALTEPARHPLVLHRGENIFLALHFPSFRQKEGEEEKFEIDLVIGKDFLITLHYETIDSFERFAKDMETDAILHENSETLQSGNLLLSMIHSLYINLSTELDGIEDRLEDAEDHVFGGGEQKMVKVLSDINKNLLDATQALRPHREVLDTLRVVGKESGMKGFLTHLHMITAEYEKISRIIQAHRETLTELRETNDSLLSAKTNNVMKILTIITFATYPSIFITGLYGMNVSGQPIAGNPFDFWIIFLIIVLVTSLIISFFVYKRWF